MSQHIRTRDGRCLHLIRRGTGEPVVVFESGIGANRGSWTLVEPQVQAATLVYDRAGLGRSTPDPGPRTVSRMTEDLLDLLAAAGIRRAVLVGHSLGGVVVRHVAHLRPELVAGLVLVDQVQEELPHYHEGKQFRLVSLGYRTGALLARTGLLKLLLRGRLHRDFPPEIAREITDEELSPGFLTAAAAEVRALPGGLAELPPLRLPQVPTTVISAGRTGPAEKKFRPVLIETHRAFAAALPHGRHVLAERADHLVPLQQPDLVAAEINRLL
ncbi:alpha/beta hydrolase [Crossiella sp. CA-258035]|uniref:alpha/beta fold hydrolase n=1 Tax=Crossiella sp. CA-258035 TaxID=2981138 RepID=UPI0024BCE91B|nr:alpha/beta hydrolase [Crossiella sp. CA-258035]WHT20038.1 alpha/beta hydrolase [Crossiella sp. CA-258035]